MQPVKVVVAGPFGAGKTTFIRTISEVAEVSTEREITDDSGFGAKQATTVAIDFGRITLGGGVVIYLFGTPGQERFDFMWEVASQGMLGFILLVDCERPESLTDTRRIFDWFRRSADVPYLIAANKAFESGVDVDRIRAELCLSADEPILQIDARDRDSVKAALLAFLERKLDALLDV